MLNHITIMGRLTRDPSLRNTQNGAAVASFTLAVDRDFKAESGAKETDFIECVAWRNTAEFVNKYFTKGRMAVVSGRLQLRKYTDKDGNNRTVAEVVADNVYFADSKKEEGNGNSYGDLSNSPVPESSPSLRGTNGFTDLPDDDDELPFN